MSLLFTIENKVVKPHIETLLICPFKDIWDRDDSKNKYKALEEFAFIEFSVSQLKSNPYKGYEESIRREKLLNDIITQEDWKEDDLIFDGIEKIRTFQTEASVTYTYYMSALQAAKKLKDFFNTFNMNEVNARTGNPMYKPKDITSALKETNSMLQDLKNLEEKVEQELFESTKTKGQKEISPFADPNSL